MSKNMKKQGICAVVVTYNRKELLKECLTAILGQTHQVTNLVVIDNASTDGTTEMLNAEGFLSNPLIQYHRMKSNTGGAGGFYEGIKRAMLNRPEWVWVMDDDTIPCEDCLEELIRAGKIIKQKLVNTERKISYLASAVYGKNHEFMNVPAVSQKNGYNGYPYWYEMLHEGIVNITWATFVSILINSDAVKECGLPNPEYFIWGDDIEYTTRLSNFYGEAYFVGKSVAIHKRSNPISISIDRETDLKRIGLFRYEFRNNSINNRYYGVRFAKTRSLLSIISSIRYIGKENGLYKMRIQMTGNIEAFIKYKRFRQYIDDQLSKGMK